MARQAEFLPASAEIVEEFEFQRDEPKTERDKKVDDFADAMRELSDNGEVIVKRQTGNGKEPMEHVAVFEPDEYSYSQLVEHLRREYGGGLYRIYLRSGGKNRGNSLIRIAETLNKGVDNRPTIGGEVGSILQTVLERMDRIQQNQPQQSEKDFLEKMMIYKQLFSDNKTTTNPMAQIRETMELMNLLKEGNTIEQEPENGFSKLIESLAPVAMAAMQQPPRQQTPQPNTQPKTNPQSSQQNMQLLAGLSTLVKAAAKNANPATYAEMVLDMVPEETIKPYIVKQGEFLELLKRYAPPAVKYAAWFDDLREHLAACLGLPSKYADLYDTAEDAITGEIDQAETSTNDAKDIPTTPDK